MGVFKIQPLGQNSTMHKTEIILFKFSKLIALLRKLLPFAYALHACAVGDEEARPILGATVNYWLAIRVHAL